MSKHALFEAAPVVSESFPAPHSTHVLAADAPTAAEYVPTSHSTHACVCARSRLENVPGGQSVHALAPRPANAPAGHGAHSAAPLEFLNVPAPHATHGPPSKPWWPLVHVQASRTALAAGEFVFAGQGAQAPAPAAANVSGGQGVQALAATPPTAVPGGHGAQAALPAAALKVPAAQGAHAAPADPVYPATHLQSNTTTLPAGADEFAGHCVHAVAPLAA